MSTNYYNTLITIADDSPTLHSVVPDLTKTSVASQQYEWLADHPYEMTSDDVIFARVAEKESIPESERPDALKTYFETGRACLRTSPLAKKFGWGIHHNAEGKIAILAAESDEYFALMTDDTVTKVKAMKSKR